MKLIGANPAHSAASQHKEPVVDEKDGNGPTVGGPQERPNVPSSLLIGVNPARCAASQHKEPFVDEKKEGDGPIVGGPQERPNVPSSLLIGAKPAICAASQHKEPFVDEKKEGDGPIVGGPQERPNVSSSLLIGTKPAICAASQHKEPVVDEKKDGNGPTVGGPQERPNVPSSLLIGVNPARCAASQHKEPVVDEKRDGNGPTVGGPQERPNVPSSLLIGAKPAICAASQHKEPFVDEKKEGDGPIVGGSQERPNVPSSLLIGAKPAICAASQHKEPVVDEKKDGNGPIVGGPQERPNVPSSLLIGAKPAICAASQHKEPFVDEKNEGDGPIVGGPQERPNVPSSLLIGAKPAICAASQHKEPVVDEKKDGNGPIVGGTPELPNVPSCPPIVNPARCAASQHKEPGVDEKKDGNGPIVGGPQERPNVSSSLLIGAKPAICAASQHKEPGVDEKKDGNGPIVGVPQERPNVPSSPPIVNPVHSAQAETNIPMDSQLNTQDSFECGDDEWDKPVVKKQKLGDPTLEERPIPIDSASKEMEEMLKAMKGAADAYIKCFGDAHKEAVEQVKTLYRALRNIEEIMEKNKILASSRKRDYDDARKACTAAYAKVSEALPIDMAQFFKISHEVDSARHSLDNDPMSHQYSGAMRPDGESWMRKLAERRSVSVRFVDTCKPITESGVTKFYEVVKRATGNDLPMYDDYMFASVRDIRFIFTSVSEAVEFKKRLHCANFNNIGVESMKWVDMKNARQSLINENAIYITRQETNDQKDKNDVMVTTRNNGGLYSGRAEEGLDRLLERTIDPNRTPIRGPKTPIKNWNSPIEQAPATKKRKSEEMAYPVSSMSSVTIHENAELTSNVPSAIDSSRDVQRAAPITPIDDKWTVEGIQHHVRRLSQLIMEAARQGKEKEETTPMITEKRDLEKRLRVISLCDGDVDEAKKVYEEDEEARRGTAV